MSNAEPPPEEPEMTAITLRLSEPLLVDIDAIWKKEGFNSRSEFMRHALRDATMHPSFTRESWKAIAARENRLRHGEAETISSDDVKAMLAQDDR